MESIKTEFSEWWEKEDSKLGEGEYQQAISKVKEATQELPVQEITLHYQTFRFGFSFFYGENVSEKQMIPISWQDGVILKWQKENNEQPVWPIKDPKTNAYFIPKVTVNTMSPPSGSMPTEQYLEDLLKYSQRYFDARSTKILNVLTPYAKQLKEYREHCFYKIAVCFPKYLEAVN